MEPSVVAVSRDGTHRFSKGPCTSISLIEGMGVAGDAHAGTLVQHRSRARRDPNQPNLRQVHLIHAELLTELSASGHRVGPGSLGENILTGGLDLLGLPTGSRLRIGDAELQVTGLRNPCRQIEEFSPGLLSLVAPRVDGGIVRRAGVMAVVERGGRIAPGMPIEVVLPDGPGRPLAPV